MTVIIIPVVISAFGTVTKGLSKGTGGLGIWRTSGDHPNNSIIENGQNCEKSPGDLRRFVVTQTLVKYYQVKLMWKTLILMIIIIYQFSCRVINHIKLRVTLNHEIPTLFTFYSATQETWLIVSKFYLSLRKTFKNNQRKRASSFFFVLKSNHLIRRK